MAKGYNASADLVTTTADGVDLNALWADYQQVLAQWNSERTRLINFLTFPVTQNIETVPVIGADGDFQEATEYGVPTSIRPEADYYQFGYDFKWYDLARRFTWQFLAEAPQSQLDAIVNMALEADNRLVFTKVMKRVFNPTNNLASIKGQNYNVYTFYNGEGEAPPPYKSNTFASDHTHFLASGAAAITPGDLEDIITHLSHHGYSDENGHRLVVMMNSTETDVVRLFKNGVNGATYDFIPAQGTPSFFLPENTTLVGGQPPASINGFVCVGSYGPLLIIKEDLIPTKYVFAFASGGADSIQNPVGFRQHANAGLRGMRLVKGLNPDYPLMDSYWIRGFGTGVRHRGAGVVMQITTNPAYAAPALYA